jgi:prepilin-type N-terminal cleavage/methylation domain-containing protein
MNQVPTVLKCRQPLSNGERRGFTLVELLVVTAVIGIISSILLSALSTSRLRAQAIVCLNNTRQMGVAWHNYSEDNEGKLVYNFDSSVPPPAQLASIDDPNVLNWVNNQNVLDWSLRSANTNVDHIVRSRLGPYAGNYKLYHCPNDNVLHPSQQARGWSHRIRSYSMNAMVGDAGTVIVNGSNTNNPGYQQYFKYTAIEQPSEIFVFLDEHPDTIDDGYFVNRVYDMKWRNLPASYHNGAAAMSFADLHSELHRWVNVSTRKAARPGAFSTPPPQMLPSGDREDFLWMANHSSEHY